MEFRQYMKQDFRPGDDLGAWPWTQYRGIGPQSKRVISPPPDKSGFSLMDLDEDESGSDFELEYSSSDEDTDEITSSEEDETIEEDEVNDVVDEEKNWDYDKWRKDQAFDAAVAELEEVERLAPAQYDPDETVSLVTEFYELLVEMGHWELGSVQYPPHALNFTLGKKLGYDDNVLGLMHKLPYYEGGERWGEGRIWDDTDFLNYRLDEHLEIGRHPSYYFADGEDYGAYIESHMLALAYPGSKYGWVLLLDTKLGVIRAYNSDGPRYDAIEWHRYGKFPVNNDYEASTKCHPPQHLEYKLATCIPAAVYLRNLIDCYRSLDRIPIVNPQQSDPTNDDKPSGPSSDPYNRYNEDGKKERATLKRLYKQYGWPDNWRREEFLETWSKVEERLRAE